MAASVNTSTQMSPCQKVESILDHGILSSGGEFKVSKSYDSSDSGTVSLNCINAIKGISVSLFHKAKGGITVAIEEEIGVGGCLDRAIERNLVQIAACTEKLKPAYNQTYAMLGENFIDGLASTQARQEVLSEDVVLIQEISQKAHNTALFILDLEDGKGVTAHDGCAEIGKSGSIPKEKISQIYVSKQFEEEFSNLSSKNISFIESKSQELTFHYKDGLEFSLIKFKSVSIPDYQSALEKRTLEKDLRKDPIHTHMTRL